MRRAVDRDALREVIQALLGPAHRIRELQALMGLSTCMTPNPIQRLIDDHNALPTKRAIKLTHLVKVGMLVGPRPQTVDGQTYLFAPDSVPELLRKINEAFNDMLEDTDD